MIAKAVITNIQIHNIRDPKIYTKKKYSELHFDRSSDSSLSPHFPNFPPQNTPPDINYLRNIYLNYLTKTNLK